MKIYFFLLLIFLPGLTFAQKDSLLVINTFQYDVRYGVSMYHRMCTNQKTYNLKNQLLREISYKQKDSINFEVDNLVYYFYQDDKLVSQENYSADAKLKNFTAYQYDNAGDRIIREVKATLINDKPVILESQDYTYGENTTTIVLKNENKKKTAQTLIVKSPNLILTTTTYTKYYAGFDKISSITSKILLKDDTNIEEKTNTYNTNNTIDSLTTINEFDKKKQLVKSSHFKNGVLLEKLNFDYYPDGKLKSKIVYNSDEKMILYLSFEVNKIAHQFGGLKSVYLEKYNGKL